MRQRALSRIRRPCSWSICMTDSSPITRKNQHLCTLSHAIRIDSPALPATISIYWILKAHLFVSCAYLHSIVGHVGTLLHRRGAMPIDRLIVEVTHALLGLLGQLHDLVSPLQDLVSPLHAQHTPLNRKLLDPGAASVDAPRQPGEPPARTP